MVLLDELMPVYDVVERHRIVVRAAPDIVFDAIREANLAPKPPDAHAAHGPRSASRRHRLLAITTGRPR